jgi:regulator of protease activity HflC (stomatin/prohibitin superfamily)
MNAKDIQMQAADAATKAVPIVIVLVIIGALMVNSVVIVDSGYVGVVRTLGAVQPTFLPEGFHFRKPFIDKVEQMDIRMTTSTAKAEAASKDLQIVETDVTVQYSLIASLAPQTFQRVGVRDAVAVRIIEPAIQESVKAVTAQYTAEQLVTQRADVKREIHEAISAFIKETLKQKEISAAVMLANTAITDFKFSAEFNKAIEMKVRTEQEALQAENEKKKLVTEAEAKAEQVKLAAAAKAYEIEQESVARAAAIHREAEALRDNPALIELRAVEQWDGVLPRFSGGSGAVPFIDVNNLVEDGP